MKQGFTLIELLAVILILGIISLIAIPTVTNIVKESKESSMITSVKNITRTAEEKCIRQQINNEKINYTYIINNGVVEAKLDIKGNIPMNGVISLDTYCKAKTVVFDDKYIVISTVEGTTLKPNNSLYKDETVNGRFIYKGENPDNFIYLEDNQANSLYRIISYEPDGTMKVMKYYPFYKTTFDSDGIRNISGTYCSTNGCNAWYKEDNIYINGSHRGRVPDDSEINKFLNITYYNQLSDKLKKVIVNHDFNIGGINHTLNSGVGPNVEQLVRMETTNKWTGKIGLINVSDYMKATNNNACDANSNAYVTSETGAYEHYKCGEDNYLNYKYYVWTMNPFLNNPRNVYVIWYNGGINRAYASNSIMHAMPVFFIDAKVNLTGTGTQTDPFKIVDEFNDIKSD